MSFTFDWVCGFGSPVLVAGDLIKWLIGDVEEAAT